MKQAWFFVFLLFLFTGLLWGSEGSAGNLAQDDLFSGLTGKAMTAEEMEDVDGSLLAAGTTIRNSLSYCKPSYYQKAEDPSQPHCDVLAHNTASRFGRDVRDQSGRHFRCNRLKVSQIYTRFPRKRYSTPPRNTVGFIFTNYGNGKEHMQVYSRGNGNTYTRHWNNSYNSFTSVVSYNWRSTKHPESRDVFVPLPKAPRVYFR